MQRSILFTVALCSICGIAFAQQQRAPSDSSGSQTPGVQTATSATVTAKYVNLMPADVMSSRMIGVTVYNNQEESLGEIRDLIIKDGKTITGVVVNVGGFLGIGETYVALDPSTIVLTQKDGAWRAHVDTNRDDLKNSPKFQYSGDS